MNDQGFHTVDKAVVSAQLLGGLNPSSIWALFCMILITYVWYIARQAAKMQDIRLQEALASAKLADAVARLAEKIAQLQLIVLQKQLGGSGDIQAISKTQG